MQQQEEKEIWERLTSVEQSVKSAHHRIDTQQELINSVSSLASEVKYIRVDMNEVCKDVDELKSKPNKRYELIVTTIITAIASGVVGFFISKLIGG